MLPEIKNQVNGCPLSCNQKNNGRHNDYYDWYDLDGVFLSGAQVPESCGDTADIIMAHENFGIPSPVESKRALKRVSLQGFRTGLSLQKAISSG